MFLLMPILFSLAANANVDPAKFAATAKLAASSGEAMQGNDYDFRVLKHITPNDTSVSHRAEYFSDIGFTYADGHFEPTEVSVVSENWQHQDNGDWVVDQWIWSVNLQGEPYNVAHIKLTENKDGSVIGDDYLPTGKATDPEEIARFETKFNSEWAQ